VKEKFSRNIFYYKNYYLDFFKTLRPEVKKKFSWTLQLIQDLEYVPVKYFNHMTGTTGLFEIRVEVGSNIYRVFSFFDEGKLIVIINGFQKKTQKTPAKEIEKAEKFIRNNLDKLRQWKTFADGVTDELNKAAKPDANITALVATFNSLYKGEVVLHFKLLQETVQKIKDAYFRLMQVAATDMAVKYTTLQKDVEALLEEIAALPEGLNDEANTKATNINQYISQRTSAVIDIGYDVKDKQTRFTYSEMLSFIQLFNSYKTNLEIIKSGLILTVPPTSKPGEPTAPTKKIYTSTLPGKKVKVSEYKTWLQNELQKISGAAADDEIEII